MFLNKKFIYFFLFLSANFFSQENKAKNDSIKNNKLDEVIVTATRTTRQLSSIPMPVTLVSQKQIKQVGATRLGDILLELTGITTVIGFGGFKGVQLQGLDAEYTLILIDGMPLIGRRSGNLDLERITVNNIKQIEIVKGPSSSLYGSEALGGVINIITQKPTTNLFKGNLQLFTRGGAKNELDINANSLFRKNNFGFSADVNLNSSNGFDLSPKTSLKTTYPHQNFTGSLRLMYNFSDKFKATISNRYFAENQNSPTIDSSQKDWSINTEVSHKISDKTKLNYTFYATNFNTKSKNSTAEDIFIQSLLRPEINAQFLIKKINFFTGIGVNFEKVDRTDFLRKQSFTSQYIFTQTDFYLLKNLNLILGARFDNHSEYKSAISPKISANYKINKFITTRASIGYGFKAPDFRQLYFNFRNIQNGYVVFGIRTLHELYGNIEEIKNLEADLNPENSLGINTGFELKPFNNLKININLFRNNIKDLINSFDAQIDAETLNLPKGTRIFTYENRNKVYTQGVEVDVNYKINDNFNFIAGYQYLEAKDKGEEDLIKRGEVFLRRAQSSPSERMTLSNYFGLVNRSKHMANTKLFYKNFKHRFTANIRAIYRSKYALYDTNNSQGIIDEYDDFVAGNILVNAAIEKQFFDLLKVQIGIDNLLNERGEENQQNFENNDTVLQLGNTFYGRVIINI